MLPHLNELDLCGLLLTEYGLGQIVIQFEKVQTGLTRLGARAFQGCQGVWHYSWVFRVVFFNVNLPSSEICYPCNLPKKSFQECHKLLTSWESAKP